MKLQRIFGLGGMLLFMWTISHCGGRALGNNQTDSGITGSGDTTPPTIQSIAPADSETDTYLNPSIVITFNKTMGAPSLAVNTSSTACTGTIQLSRASDNFAANTCVQFSGQPASTGTAFTVTPASALTSNTQYKLLVTTDARDASGNALSSSSTTTFTTGTSTDVAGVCDTVEDVRAIGNTLDLTSSTARAYIGPTATSPCTLPELTVTMVNRDSGASRGFFLQRSKSSAAIFVYTATVDPGAMTPPIGVGDKITIPSFTNICVTHNRKSIQITKYNDTACTSTSNFVNGDFTKNGTNATYINDLATLISVSRSFTTADESRLYAFTVAATINGGDSFDFTATYGAGATPIKIRKTALALGQLGIGASTIIGRLVPARNNDDWELNVYGSGAGGTTNFDAVTAGGGENGFGFKNIVYTVAPTILSFSPAAGSSSVPNTATTFVVTFDQSMNVSTLNMTNFHIRTGNDCAAGSVLTASGVVASNNDKTFTLTINGGQLTANATYVTCVTTSVSSAWGLNLASTGTASWTAIIPPIYSFTALNSGDALSTVGMTIRCTPTNSDGNALLANTPAGSYTGATNVGSSSFGVLGLGTNGISFSNVASANASCNGGAGTGYISALDIPMNTTGKTGISLQFKAGQYQNQTRDWAIRLQYSLDGTTFTDFDSTGARDFDSVKAASTIYTDTNGMFNFGPYLLPAGANNNANLVIRWRYYQTASTGGSVTRIVMDEILVSDNASADSTAPTVGTLSINGTGTQSALTWAGGTDNTTPASNIIYRVYTHSSTGFVPPGTGTLLYTTLPGETAYTHTGLSTGTAYYYKVIAVDAQNNLSGASNEVTYTPVDTTPPTISSTNPANGATGVAFAPSASVTFSEAMNVANAQAAYSVKKTNCSGATVSTGSPTSTNPTFTYTLTNLEPSTVYAHCVTTTATDSAGNALATAYSSTWTTAALTEPTGVTFTPGDMQVTISFVVGNGNGGVQIVRGAAGAAAPADCNSGTAVYNGSTSPQVETGLTNGQTYAYRVCTRHNAGAYLSAGVTGSATPVDAFNVTGAASTANTTATVTFSAAPNTAQAQTAGNYEIVLAASACGSGGILSVSSPSLSTNTVTMTTAAQTGGTSYKVCVTNVTRNSDGLTLTTSSATFTGTAAIVAAITDHSFEAGTVGAAPASWTSVVGATVSSAQARSGTKSLLLSSNPGSNSTAFDIPNSLKVARGANTKLAFWIYGTADKALVFTFNGTNTGQRRCGPITTSDVTATNSSAYGGPTGEINTSSAWRKCTIDFSAITTDYDAANPIRLRVGSAGNYNVYLDDFSYEP